MPWHGRRVSGLFPHTNHHCVLPPFVIDRNETKQILAAFKYVEEAAEGVVGKAERVVDQIKQEL